VRVGRRDDLRRAGRRLRPTWRRSTCSPRRASPRSPPAARGVLRRAPLPPEPARSTAASARGFAEDDLEGKVLAIGKTLRLRVFMPTIRCALTTRAQEDLPADPAILRTWSAARRQPGRLRARRGAGRDRVWATRQGAPRLGLDSASIARYRRRVAPRAAARAAPATPSPRARGAPPGAAEDLLAEATRHPPALRARRRHAAHHLPSLRRQGGAGRARDRRLLADFDRALARRRPPGDRSRAPPGPRRTSSTARAPATTASCSSSATRGAPPAGLASTTAAPHARAIAARAAARPGRGGDTRLLVRRARCHLAARRRLLLRPGSAVRFCRTG